jgi:hypothetical protein
MRTTLLLAITSVLAIGACGSDDPQGATDAGAKDDAAADDDLDMRAGDFDCILDWTKVRGFRITNELGYLDEAIAAANAPEGAVYPVGTIIQLVPFEAMVKRKAGFSAETSDWEFFSLSVSSSGTVIEQRGTTDVTNQFGGNCFDCHAKAAPQWDFVCEKTNGCDPLPLTDEQIENIQNNDPRCD